MYSKCSFSLLFAALVSASASGAPKSFDGITCKSDIQASLVGRYMSNDTVARMESKYRSIELTDLGAYGMEVEGDPWTLISWRICRREYLVLERRGIVTDVLGSPLETRDSESRIVSCIVDGLRVPNTAVVFAQPNSEKWPRSIKDAWIINDDSKTFKKISGGDVVCAP